VKYAWIAAHQMEFDVETMCRLLDVGKSGFYAAQNRPHSAGQMRCEELLCEIKNVHVESRGTYGSPRVFEELKAQGIKVCKNTVAKIMSKGEIRSKIREALCAEHNGFKACASRGRKRARPKLRHLCYEPKMGDGYHLHRDGGRLAVPGRRAGSA